MASGAMGPEGGMAPGGDIVLEVVWAKCLLSSNQLLLRSWCRSNLRCLVALLLVVPRQQVLGLLRLQVV